MSVREIYDIKIKILEKSTFKDSQYVLKNYILGAEDVPSVAYDNIIKVSTGRQSLKKFDFRYHTILSLFVWNA